jgi:hypothetical protein
MPVFGALPPQDVVDELSRLLELKDQKWAEIFGEVARLVDVANQAYGASTEKSAEIMSVLWPKGVPVDRLHDARCMISILDKLSRIVEDRDAFGESPWRDIMGYAALAYRHTLAEKERKGESVQR